MNKQQMKIFIKEKSHLTEVIYINIVKTVFYCTNLTLLYILLQKDWKQEIGNLQYTQDYPR